MLSRRFGNESPVCFMRPMAAAVALYRIADLNPAFGSSMRSRAISMSLSRRYGKLFSPSSAGCFAALRDRRVPEFQLRSVSIDRDRCGKAGLRSAVFMDQGEGGLVTRRRTRLESLAMPLTSWSSGAEVAAQQDQLRGLKSRPRGIFRERWFFGRVSVSDGRARHASCSF